MFDLELLHVAVGVVGVRNYLLLRLGVILLDQLGSIVALLTRAKPTCQRRL